jgi:hypothetical protein
MAPNEAVICIIIWLYDCFVSSYGVSNEKWITIVIDELVGMWDTVKANFMVQSKNSPEASK